MEKMKNNPLPVIDHDKPVLDLMLTNAEGFTIIQVANKLKRSRLDVKKSFDRLVESAHLKQGAFYNKFYSPHYDYLPECVAKRPEHYADKIKALQERTEQLEQEIKNITQHAHIGLIFDWVICGISTNSMAGTQARRKRMDAFYSFRDQIESSKKVLERVTS